MKVVKYYCDCCGREVPSEMDLHDIVIYSPFLDMQDNPHPYKNKAICRACMDELDREMSDKYNEIRLRVGKGQITI